MCSFIWIPGDECALSSARAGCRTSHNTTSRPNRITCRNTGRIVFVGQIFRQIWCPNSRQGRRELEELRVMSQIDGWPAELDHLDRHYSATLPTPDTASLVELMQTYKVPGVSIA